MTVADVTPCCLSLSRYQFQSSLGHFETKEAILTDSDSVWTDVRHMHMRDAIDKLMADFNGFLKEHGGFSAKQGAVTLNDMKDMLASLPQYQEMREKVRLSASACDVLLVACFADSLALLQRPLSSRFTSVWLKAAWTCSRRKSSVTRGWSSR